MNLCSDEVVVFEVGVIPTEKIIVGMCTNCFRKWVYSYVYSLCRAAYVLAREHEFIAVTLILEEMEHMQAIAQPLNSQAVVNAIRTFNRLYPDELNSYITKFSVN